MSHTTCRKQKVQYAFPALDGDGGVIINNYKKKVSNNADVVALSLVR